LAISHEDRRSILRNLTDEQYADIMRVCSFYPHVEMDANLQIIDDEDEHTITAGALVTLVVNLTRHSMKSIMNMDDPNPNPSSFKTSGGDQQDSGDMNDIEIVGEQGESNGAENDEKSNAAAAAAAAAAVVKQSTHKPWEKQQKKKGKFAAKPNKNKNNSKSAKDKNAANKSKATSEKSGGAEANEVEKAAKTAENDDEDEANEEEASDNESEQNEEAEEAESQQQEQKPTGVTKRNVKKDDNKSSGQEDSMSSSPKKDATNTEDSDYLEKFQQMQKKKEKLETKAKISHRVYCPHFPDVSFQLT
jgi:translocation protein SEC63